MSVIFLDFDGVLVTAKSFRIRSGRQATADPACVQALNHITDETGAEIVISSSWRIGTAMSELIRLTRKWGITGRVIGRTPHLGFSVPRGEEILTWIRNHEYDVENFVILDDDSDMCILHDSHVKTYFDSGLTMEDAELAIGVLNGAKIEGNMLVLR